MAVEGEKTMADKLAGLVAGIGESEAVNNVVQAAFEKNEQVGTGDALLHISLGKIAVELTFQQPVSTTRLLLLTKLGRVFGNLLAGTAVLAGSQRPAIKSALAGEAAITLQKELAPLTAADAALSFSIFSHWNSSL